MTQTTMSKSSFLKLFYFLQSETPAEIKWVKAYLFKHSYVLSDRDLSLSQIKEHIFQDYLTNFSFRELDTISTLSKKMYKAYKARTYRKKMGANKMLNVSISHYHIKKLHEMATCRRKTKIQIVEYLIDDNYKFLERQKEKELAAKKKRKSNKESIEEQIKNATNKYRSVIDNLEREVSNQKLKISTLEGLFEKLTINSSTSVEMTTEPNENKCPIEVPSPTPETTCSDINGDNIANCNKEPKNRRKQNHYDPFGRAANMNR